MIYLKLLWAFIQVGLFSIGGGYAALPMIQSQVVTTNAWLSMEEFTDIITIAEMTPGPIAINCATFVGTRLGGIPGACVATLGCVLPSFVIVIALSVLYKKYKNIKAVDGVLSGLRPAAVGMISAAGASIVVLALWGGAPISLSIDFIALAIIAAAVFILRKFKISPIFVMVGAGAIGGAIYYFIK